jgi:hypothetical protein
MWRSQGLSVTRESLSLFFQFSPSNHQSTIAPYSSITASPKLCDSHHQAVHFHILGFGTSQNMMEYATSGTWWSYWWETRSLKELPLTVPLVVVQAYVWSQAEDSLLRWASELAWRPPPLASPLCPIYSCTSMHTTHNLRLYISCSSAWHCTGYLAEKLSCQVQSERALTQLVMGFVSYTARGMSTSQYG